MPLSKTIKIFLASSITELEVERVLLADYINNTVAPIFENGRVHVRLFKCEDDPSGNCGESSQTRFDNELKDSDVSIFLFKKKAGEQTLQEFDLARELQNTKKHEIYVYCFDVQESDKSTELIAFQQRLEKEKFYWKTCDDINSLKAQFLPGLLKYHFGTKSVDFIEQETDTEKSGDARFIEYEANKEKQTRLRAALHKDIENLLQQVNSVMADENQNITVRIAKALDLYKKADRWAATTEYDTENYIFLLSDYACFLENHGMYNDSEEIYLRLVSLAERFYGQIHSNTSKSYNNIGGVYWRKGNLGKALSYYIKSLEIKEALPTIDSMDVATTLVNIGTIYGDKGEYNKALEYYQHAQGLLNDSSDVRWGRTIAALYNNIAIVNRKLGDYPAALDNCFLALDECKKAFGEEHPNTASTLNNIGQVYENMGLYDKALKYHNDALEMNIKCLGPEHPNIALDYNNIGFLYANNSNFPKALEYYKKALKIKMKSFGEDHPGAATCYNNIGYAYFMMKDFGNAVSNLSKALKIRQRILGSDHNETKETEQILMLAKLGLDSGS